MDFLVYSRGAVAAHSQHDPALDEQHWSYMDAFSGGMTARGPTLGTDRETWTGSVHIVDLPGPSDVRDFVAREPYDRAGLYQEHLIWCFTNLLGRTMWQFIGAADEPRFFALAREAVPLPIDDLSRRLRDRLIVYGALRTLDDEAPAGVALALQAPSRGALDDLLGGYGDAAIFDWEFGGRR